MDFLFFISYLINFQLVVEYVYTNLLNRVAFIIMDSVLIILYRMSYGRF